MAASLACHPEWETPDLPLVPLLAGIAAARVIDCGLKWPNDVLIDDRKVGGILVESSDGVVVVGFGLNLWWPEAPDGYGALHVEDPGPERAVELAERWAGELLELIDAGPANWPRDEYRSISVTIGRDITWSPDGIGRAIDIAPDGALIVTTPAGQTLPLHASEVRHIR
jgi:BirA family transcriptional regulator, biotin operon repressor / biotin---[acetyl-CoA-carboxylase] ligase